MKAPGVSIDATDWLKTVRTTRCIGHTGTTGYLFQSGGGRQAFVTVGIAVITTDGIEHFRTQCCTERYIIRRIHWRALAHARNFGTRDARNAIVTVGASVYAANRVVLHCAGDFALFHTAGVLRLTFRQDEQRTEKGCEDE